MTEYPASCADVLVTIQNTGPDKLFHFSGGNNLVPYTVNLEWSPPYNVRLKRVLAYRYGVHAAGEGSNVQLSLQLPLMTSYCPILGLAWDDATPVKDLFRAIALDIFVPAGTLFTLSMTDSEGIPPLICYLEIQYPGEQTAQGPAPCKPLDWLMGEC